MTTEPATVPTSPQPMTNWVASASPTIDSAPVAMRPLYSAPMIELFAPSLTKNVPMIEVTMQAAQIASGYIMLGSREGVPSKKIEASTIVATTVTA